MANFVDDGNSEDASIRGKLTRRNAKKRKHMSLNGIRGKGNLAEGVRRGARARRGHGEFEAAAREDAASPMRRGNGADNDKTTAI